LLGSATPVSRIKKAARALAADYYFLKLLLKISSIKKRIKTNKEILN